MDLNKAMVIGRLTKDPEVKTTPTGQNVTSFSLATNFTWKDQSGQKQERVEFHNIVAWRRLAEICGQYLKKGSKIYIEGRIQTRDWTGQDGIKRYRTEIVAENMIMLDSRSNSNENTFSTSTPKTENNTPTPNNNEPIINVDDDLKEKKNNPSSTDEINVEEIPF